MHQYLIVDGVVKGSRRVRVRVLFPEAFSTPFWLLVCGALFSVVVSIKRLVPFVVMTFPLVVVVPMRLGCEEFTFDGGFLERKT